MKLSSLLLLAFTLVYSLVSTAEEILVLRNESMPFCGTVDGKDAGMAVEILSAITSRGGPKFIYRSVIWPEAQNKVHTIPNSMIIPLTRTASREHKYQWVTELFSHQVRISHEKSRPITNKVSLLPFIEETRTQRIGIISGSALIPRMESLGFTQLVKSKNAVINARMLQKGRVDAIVESQWVDTYSWQDAGFKKDDLKIALPIDEPQQIYLAAGLNFPRETAQEINSIMTTLEAKGVIDQILSKWR